ncbi:MAG: hypothetical protein M3Q34_03745 [bacterium]|nr:hypothetical protein [bacterium]
MTIFSLFEELRFYWLLTKFFWVLLKLYWTEIKLFSLGFIVYKVITIFYSFVIVPKIILKFNFQTSLIVLSFISVFKSWLIVYLYDLSKIDCFQIEKVKHRRTQKQLAVEEPEDEKEVDVLIVTEERGQKRRVRNVQLRMRIKKINGFTAYLFLICYDPALVVLWTRKGSHSFDGIPKNVKVVFLVSCFLSTLIWIGGVEAFFALWKYCSRLIDHLYL